MSPIACVILAAGAIGHVVLWVALVNRTHALGIHRHWVDLITVVCGIILAALPPLIAVVLTGLVPVELGPLSIVASSIVWTYLTLCAGLLLVAIFQRWSWSSNPERHGSLLINQTSVICHPDSQLLLLSPGIPSWFGKLPGNQVLSICLVEKTIAIPRWSHAREPLRIVHLSDLHMSGRITRRYFERVAEETNALKPDLIAITGDIVEREPCIEWIADTLGSLRAAAGVYYVLGNHDRNVNIERLKSALADAGLTHLGADCRKLSIRDTPIILGGNELPWLASASNFDNAPHHDESGLPLRILLSHSPDQFQWAQSHDVDVILAGHLHGGQVRLPLLGAIVAPSRYGVRYAAGAFTAGSTVMHVSRGTGSLTPLRYNCPPEIAVLTLSARQTT